MRAALSLLAGLLLLAGLACPEPARAQKAADTLRLSWRDAIPDLDPYYNQLRTGLVVAQTCWDTLVYQDPDTFQIKPLLATAWTLVDPLTLDFTLRPGVTFHNGDPFTAEDVAYTVNTVAADPNVAVPGNYAFLDHAQAIDPLHVRLTLKRPFPAALDYLSVVLPIWPHAYRQRVGAAGFAAAPVGTGPYRISRVDGLREIDLERNDAYFAGPKGHPAIAHIVIHEVPDDATEIADLLAGRADWIWQFPEDQLDAIGSHPELQVLRAESMRIGYLSMDAAGRSGIDNPLTRQGVRQAVAQAIDRVALAHMAAGGAARVLNAPCYPTQFGCDAGAATRWDYDPAAARAALAQAGYPKGFATTLVSFVLPQYGQAVQAALRAIGIDATLRQLPVGQAVAVQDAGQAPLFLGSWGSYSINDVAAILPQFFAGGPQDYARDPQTEQLVATGDTATDPDERRNAYAEAIRRITSHAYWLPLNTYVTTYGFSRTLNFRAFPDELPRFYLASWR